jgi:hypothetical protein
VLAKMRLRRQYQCFILDLEVGPVADREPLLARTPSGHREATLIKRFVRAITGSCVTSSHSSFDARATGDLKGVAEFGMDPRGCGKGAIPAYHTGF